MSTLGFGATKEKVFSVLGKANNIYYDGIEQELLIWTYGIEDAIHIHFSKANNYRTFHSLQIFAPEKAYFHDIQLIDQNKEPIIALFKSIDKTMCLEDNADNDGGLTSLKYDIDITWKEGRITEVTVEPKGTYKNLLSIIDKQSFS